MYESFIKNDMSIVSAWDFYQGESESVSVAVQTSSGKDSSSDGKSRVIVINLDKWISISQLVKVE